MNASNKASLRALLSEGPQKGLSLRLDLDTMCKAFSKICMYVSKSRRNLVLGQKIVSKWAVYPKIGNDCENLAFFKQLPKY